MNKLLIAAIAAIALTGPLQADEKQPGYADYNKALLKIGVEPEIAAVVAQIALTKVQDMATDQTESDDDR